MKTWESLSARLCLMGLLAVCGAPSGVLASMVFVDTYDVTDPEGAYFNINQDLGGRQSGPLATVSYVANTADNSNDYHHQVFSPAGPLQLAADAAVPNGIILASPNADFSGLLNGEVIGKRMSVDLDVYANAASPPGNTFTNAAITIGASNPLAPANTDGFTVTFVEDNFVGSGLGNFLQFFDGSGGAPVQNVIANPAGSGSMNVVFEVDDPTDGDPWDGVGQTTISVFVDGSQVGTPFTQFGGGYTSNYVTFEGFFESVGFGLTTHKFDNFTVEALPVPEPASAVIGIAAVTGLCLLRRRNK